MTKELTEVILKNTKKSGSDGEGFRVDVNNELMLLLKRKKKSGSGRIQLCMYNESFLR